MEPTHRTVVLPIAGYAGAGKDTLAKAIAHYCREKMVLTLKFADVLKEAVNDALRFVQVEEVAFTEDRHKKAAIRPLLVEFGKYCRSVDESVFADCVCKTVRAQAPRYDVIFITDLRYKNELKGLEKVATEEEGILLKPIYVETIGVAPANDEEKGSIAGLLYYGDDTLDRHTFRHGDFDAIDEVARRYAKLITQ